MPSHLKVTDERPEGVSICDVLSNSHADVHAGLAATRAQIAEPLASKYIEEFKLASSIQRRLVEVVLSLPKRDTEYVVRPPKPKPVPLEELIARTEHKLFTSGDRQVCTRCLSGFSVKDPCIRHWLRLSCRSSMIGSTSRPNPLPHTDAFHIGNQTVHHSHTLRQHKGLIYCKSCGYLAGTKIHKLAEPCEPPKAYGKRNLKNIGDDRLPYSITEWPTQRLGLNRALGASSSSSS